LIDNIDSDSNIIDGRNHLSKTELDLLEYKETTVMWRLLVKSFTVLYTFIDPYGAVMNGSATFGKSNGARLPIQIKKKTIQSIMFRSN
jgi:hypothetical protein